jgi:hypothetical protein
VQWFFYTLFKKIEYTEAEMDVAFKSTAIMKWRFSFFLSLLGTFSSNLQKLRRPPENVSEKNQQDIKNAEFNTENWNG